MIILCSNRLHSVGRPVGRPVRGKVRKRMLLRTSRQGRGYVEPTGKPVEGRLVGVIPTKTSGLGKREANISHEGTVTGNNRVASVCFQHEPCYPGRWEDNDRGRNHFLRSSHNSERVQLWPCWCGITSTGCHASGSVKVRWINIVTRVILLWEPINVSALSTVVSVLYSTLYLPSSASNSLAQERIPSHLRISSSRKCSFGCIVNSCSSKLRKILISSLPRLRDSATYALKDINHPFNGESMSATQYSITWAWAW